jgi:hypothetical protein
VRARARATSRARSHPDRAAPGAGACWDSTGASAHSSGSRIAGPIEPKAVVRDPYASDCKAAPVLHQTFAARDQQTGVRWSYRRDFKLCARSPAQEGGRRGAVGDQPGHDRQGRSLRRAAPEPSGSPSSSCLPQSDRRMGLRQHGSIKARLNQHYRPGTDLQTSSCVDCRLRLQKQR